MQAYSLYEERGAVQLEIWYGVDGLEYSPSPTIPEGLLPSPPSPGIKRGRRHHKTRSIPTPPEQTFNGRTSPTLTSNGRDVEGLPSNIWDDSEPFRNGWVVRDISGKWRGSGGAPESEQRAPFSNTKQQPLSLTEIPQVDGFLSSMSHTPESIQAFGKSHQGLGVHPGFCNIPPRVLEKCSDTTRI